MPPGLENLLQQGVLGSLVLFGLWGIVQAAKWGFSRDEKRPGLITLKVEASIEKDRKMGTFLDTLTENEGRRLDNDAKQRELCEQHQQGLAAISTSLASQHATVMDLARRACRLARATMLGDPPDRSRVEAELSDIERSIEGTREVA